MRGAGMTKRYVPASLCGMTIRGAAGPNAPLFDDQARHYDAVLVVSFGGPEGPDDVLPFLENVTRGRNVPRARRAELAAASLDLPIYFGNRNWRPYLTDVVREMRAVGVRRAIAFVTSAFS